jgi:nucleoside-diphosphate-sugar epimerase
VREKNVKLFTLIIYTCMTRVGLHNMTETTSINPPSKKGEIRANIANLILNRMEEGKLQALIARSADFYGPSIKRSSFLIDAVFQPLSKNNKATWFIDPCNKHSFTYTPDAGKALALLGNTPTAYGQVWHLPTAPDPLSGIEWIQAISNKMGKSSGL